LYLHSFTLLWCLIRFSVLSFVSSHLHTVVMSDTMFCSVVCIFTPSHCCDECEGVKIQKTDQNIASDITTVWRCEDTKDRTEHRIGYHNSLQVWRYKRQNRYDVLFCRLYLHTFTLLWCLIRCYVLSFASSHLHTVVMSDAMFCSVVCIFTPSHCCDVRYDVLFCLLYLHTFTLLWCLIRGSVYQTSQ
jgi:hypothetical protein